MLDQNTDRMWYVIGAVIVGAAIILLMNGAFPELFASVGETFKGKVEETTEVTDGIMPIRSRNLISPEDLAAYRSDIVSYDKETDTWTLNVHTPYTETAWWNNGLRLDENKAVVPYGESFTLSYEVYIPEGWDDAYAETDIDNYPVDPETALWSDSGNDHDARKLRVFNGVPDGEYENVDRIPLPAGEWTKVWVSYSNTDELNVDKVALYDRTRIGVYNNTGEPVEVQIRHIQAELGRRPTSYYPKR